MRRSLGKLSHPAIGNATRQTLLSSSSFTFSTSAGSGGGGRGRGRGSDSPDSHFKATTTPGKTDPEDPRDKSSFPTGMGHGRGISKPLPSTPNLPSFSSFVSSDVGSSSSVSGRGRGGGGTIATPQSPKKPIFFVKDEAIDSPFEAPSQDRVRIRNPEEESNIPSSILSILSGAGRGKPAQPSAGDGENAKEENRHLRRKERRAAESTASASPSRKLSKEEAINKARGILSKGGEDGGGRGKKGLRGGGRGGRGRGGWRGEGRRGRQGDSGSESDVDYENLGDDADGEKFAKRMGPERMNLLVEGFEEISERVLPNPMEDAILDAMDYNYSIECEPEYLMGDFCSNPDIDEKPPIPLRDALEKMKPFLMAYENIQTNQEWEEVMKETMEKVPIIKEIVDHYSGPDRVTAKRQHEELERVAKTLPSSAPASVKRFTNRAVVSLQSNPGWGFDKKCQFMDKLVREVLQSYK